MSRAMRLIERILLAQDFTDNSQKLLQSAVEFGKVFQSTIIPAHVLPDDLDNPKIVDLLTATANDKLQESVSYITSRGVSAGDPLLLFGSPHAGVVKAGVNTNANLIMVGSGIHAESENFKLGTTTERIIQESLKPVFVVKHASEMRVKRILCPVDFSETSRQALKNAITMAFRFKARLIILNVSDDQGSSWFASKAEIEKLHARALQKQHEEFDKFLDGMNLAGLQWTKEVRSGNPAKEILNALAVNDVDLLVIGTVGRSGPYKLIMGSVTAKVVREVPCSFVTIKSEDVIRLQLETRITDIENHFNLAEQLVKDGFYDAAISQYQTCLSISAMHVPAYFGIARVYEILNKPEKAELYRADAREILNRIWYQKIEDEVRRQRIY